MRCYSNPPHLEETFCVHVPSQSVLIILEKLMVAQLVRNLPHTTPLIPSSQEPANWSYSEENHVDNLATFTWV